MEKKEKKLRLNMNRKVNEKQIEQYLVRRVKEKGGIAYKFTSPGRRHVPDRIILLPGGKVIFIECKRPGAKATKAQDYELHRIRRFGVTAVVMDSKEKIDELLNK